MCYQSQKNAQSAQNHNVVFKVKAMSRSFKQYWGGYNQYSLSENSE